MGMTLVPFMENVLETTVPELGDDPTATIMTFLKGLSFDEAATLIRRLTDKRSRRPVARHRSLAESTSSALGDEGVVGIGSNGRNGFRGDHR